MMSSALREKQARQADAPWMVDAVVLRTLGADRASRLPRLGDGSYLDERVDEIPLIFDTRDGTRTVRTKGFLLAPGIRYVSFHHRHYATIDANGKTGMTRVTFEPCVRVEGVVPPVDVMLGLAGREIRSVVDHPCLDVPGLVIEKATIDTTGGEPDGISLLLGEMLVAVAARAEHA